MQSVSDIVRDSVSVRPENNHGLSRSGCPLGVVLELVLSQAKVRYFVAAASLISCGDRIPQDNMAEGSEYLLAPICFGPKQ
jgi:hypothetical protein